MMPLSFELAEARPMKSWQDVISSLSRCCEFRKHPSGLV
jgi:hypothetical protein